MLVRPHDDICIKAKKLIGMLYRRFYKNMVCYTDDSTRTWYAIQTILQEHEFAKSVPTVPYLILNMQAKSGALTCKETFNNCNECRSLHYECAQSSVT